MNEKALQNCKVAVGIIYKIFLPHHHPHQIYLQSNLGIGIRNIDCRGWLQNRASEEVGRGDVGEEDVVGGARDIREVLQSYQEEIVEESSHTGEAHLG